MCGCVVIVSKFHLPKFALPSFRQHTHTNTQPLAPHTQYNHHRRTVIVQWWSTHCHGMIVFMCARVCRALVRQCGTPSWYTQHILNANTHTHTKTEKERKRNRIVDDQIRRSVQRSQGPTHTHAHSQSTGTFLGKRSGLLGG